MSRLYNLPALKVRRRALKKNLTPAEAKFWSLVKNRGFHGYRWRRQFSVGAFVLDFYCPDSRLAVELDGQVHTRLGARERDFARTEFLRRAGIKVVRFENWRIFDDWENVEKEILQGLTGKS